MSRYCGPIQQIAFVVRDADAMMSHWARTFGVGPFLVRRDVSFDDYRYLGAAAPSPVLTIGMAHSGPLQVEVIQQHNDAPSAYRDFLEHRPEGMQHACSFYDNRADYQAGYDRLAAEGLECVHEGRARGLDIRFAYFRDPSAPFALHMEIAEALAPAVRGRIELMQALAADWDGSDPIRDTGFAPPPSS